MTVRDYILNLAVHGIAVQHADGSFAPGVNGPYHMSDTPVRNTCHWSIILFTAYRITGEEMYYTAGKRAIDAVLDKQYRPYGYSFQCFEATRKDKANGLIGQAWVFEALVLAAQVCEEDSYREVAQEVFLLHTFDIAAGLWRILDVDGTDRGYDYTFNHQLWFAAIGASLIDDTPAGKDIAAKVQSFMDMLPKTLVLDTAGYVHHSVGREHLQEPAISRFKQNLKVLMKHVLFPNKRFAVLNSGYHLFNVYGFSVLREYTTTHPFWNTDNMKRMIAAVDNAFVDRLADNPYTYAYNPPAFELMYIAHGPCAVMFDHVVERKLVQVALDIQHDTIYDTHTGLLEKNTPDATTLTARSYELYRVPVDILDTYRLC